MTLYPRDWSAAPIFAGELAPGIWIKGGILDLDTPRRPWSMVSTVLHWPSEPLPPSHPMHGTPPGAGIIAIREALPATHALVEILTDRTGFGVSADTPADRLESSTAADLQWYVVPKMLEFVALVLTDRVTGRRILGSWPDQLQDSNNAPV